jgi:hypothetical protein
MDKDRIANAIVEVVERAGGPVTLAALERKIPGFAEQPDREVAWCYEINGDNGEDMTIWDGMTESGCAALRSVLTEQRVAVQFDNGLAYLLEQRFPLGGSWPPIVLVPAATANLGTSRFLIRGPQGFVDRLVAQAAVEGLEGYRALTPAS